MVTTRIISKTMIDTIRDYLDGLTAATYCNITVIGDEVVIVSA